VASYPLLIEPWLTLSAQRVAWSAAYVALAVAIAGTFITIAWRSPRARIDAAPSEPRSITSRRRAAWVLYSAVPAGLLVAVTTYITTDLAAVPLLWILPLMLYLLSFIIVFSRRPLIRHPWMTRAGPQVLVVIAIPLFWGLRLPGVIGIAAHLVVLFVIAMICHGELARQRPPPLQLTEFFVWVAVGGLVGGTFTALLAPLVFDRVYEYPILLALAGALLPSSVRQRINAADVLLPTGIGAAALLLTRDSPPLPSPWALVITLLLGVAIFSFRKRSFRFGIALAAIFAVGELRDALGAGGNTVLDAERSYFGVYRVARNSGAEFVTLYHGTTLHGAQSVDRAKRLVPLTYYHPRGPAGDVFLRTPPGMKAGRVVGVVGLGTGSLACYGRRDEHWTYYEIDPLVARIALDPDLFTFLRDCSPPVRVVFGDARLTLAKTRLAKYDILILDAFSSDAIPVHLLTREAFRLYFALLAPHGVLAVHISNEHLDLEPVIAAVARDLALVSMVRRDFAVPDSDVAEGRRSSVWAVLARSPADLGVLSGSREWRPLRPRGDVAVWTDDFSNIVRVFDWR
jgi:hypothetical protein